MKNIEDLKQEIKLFLVYLGERRFKDAANMLSGSSDGSKVSPEELRHEIEDYESCCGSGLSLDQGDFWGRSEPIFHLEDTPPWMYLDIDLMFDGVGLSDLTISLVARVHDDRFNLELHGLRVM